MESAHKFRVVPSDQWPHLRAPGNSARSFDFSCILFWKALRSGFIYLMFFFSGYFSCPILFTRVILKQLHPSVFVARRPVDPSFHLCPSTPLLVPRLFISPCSLLLPPYPSTYPSLQAARRINISCGACPWGYTFPFYCSFDPPPYSPAAVNPRYHHRHTRQGLSLIVGLGKAAAGLKAVRRWG